MFLARFLFIVVDGNLFEVVGFENLIAVEAPQVIDPVTPHQEFRALVLTSWHRTQIIPILRRSRNLSSPLASIIHSLRGTENST